MSRSGIAGSYSFEKPQYCFPWWLHQFTFLPTVVWGFLFLHILANICYLYSFWWQPFWQMWSDISLWFWFAFLWIIRNIENFFTCPLTSAFPLWKNSYYIFLPIFWSSCLVFWCWVVWAVFIHWTHILYWRVIIEILDSEHKSWLLVPILSEKCLKNKVQKKKTDSNLY